MAREGKLVGFLLLLVVIFFGARTAGAALGPVTAGHTHISYTGTGTGTGGGMNMGPGPVPSPAATALGGHR